MNILVMQKLLLIKKRVGKSSQEISSQQTCRNVLILTVKAQDKAKMELPLDMVSL